MRVAVVLLIIGIIAYLGLRQYSIDKDFRGLVVYFTLLILGASIALPGVLGYDLPNPNDYLIKVFAPLSQVLKQLAAPSDG